MGFQGRHKALPLRGWLPKFLVCLPIFLEKNVLQHIYLLIVTNIAFNIPLSEVLFLCDVEDSLRGRNPSSYRKFKEISIMSQQEIQFENTRQSETRSYDGGYEASPQYGNDYDANYYGQKIGGQGWERNSPNARLREHMLNLRMGMAITSLVLWMGFFLMGVAIFLNSPAAKPFIIVGLVIFTILVVLANVLINRKPV
jgi:hypothetical protein